MLFDADVSGTLTLAPGAVFEWDAITAALRADAAANGIAEQYVITITADAEPEGYFYAILLGEGGMEAWSSYPTPYCASVDGVFGAVILGDEFISGSDTPAALYIQAGSGSGTITLKHVKIEVVRSSGETGEETSETTTTTTNPRLESSDPWTLPHTPI